MPKPLPSRALCRLLLLAAAGAASNHAPGPYTYTVVSTIRRHNFRPELYLLPLPDAEIRKVPLLRQNPGW